MHHTLQERKILMDINHPFIVKMHYAFQTPDRFYFVLDYINGGDLFYHLRKRIRLEEKDARLYACEIILAIGLDKVQFVFHYEILVDDPEHIGDIQNHIIRDILKEETEGIVIKRGPKSCPMLIKGI